MLSRGQILRRLLESHIHHDDEEFRAAVLELVSEERRAHNHRLADQLLTILNTSNQSRSPSDHNNWGSLPRDPERDLDLAETLEPTHRLADLVLDEGLYQNIVRFLEEYRRSDLLQAHGVPPRSKALLAGPAGCGKTLLAEAMAGELGLPYVYVHLDSVVSSFLGETAANLRRIFDHGARSISVIFFDEFDAIGKHRNDAQEHGEIKRVVNAFLQMLDRFKGRSLLLTATNHPGLLDPALWRRFDEVFYLGPPTLSQIRLLLELKLKSFRVQGFEPAEYATKLQGLTHADIERICFDAITAAILADKDILTRDDFRRQIEKQRARLKITRGVVA